jgi:hypothetical protein
MLNTMLVSLARIQVVTHATDQDVEQSRDELMGIGRPTDFFFETNISYTMIYIDYPYKKRDGELSFTAVVSSFSAPLQPVHHASTFHEKKH